MDHLLPGLLGSDLGPRPVRRNIVNEHELGILDRMTFLPTVVAEYILSVFLLLGAPSLLGPWTAYLAETALSSTSL